MRAAKIRPAVVRSPDMFPGGVRIRGPAADEARQGEAQRHRGAHEQGGLPPREYLDRAQQAGHVVAADLLGDTGQLVGAAAKEIAEPCLLGAQIASARLSPLGDGAQSISNAVLLSLDLVAQALLNGAAQLGNFLTYRLAGGTGFPRHVACSTLDLVGHAARLLCGPPLGHGRAARLGIVVRHSSALILWCGLNLGCRSQFRHGSIMPTSPVLMAGEGLAH